MIPPGFQGLLSVRCWMNCFVRLFGLLARPELSVQVPLRAGCTGSHGSIEQQGFPVYNRAMQVERIGDRIRLRSGYEEKQDRFAQCSDLGRDNHRAARSCLVHRDRGCLKGD